MTPSRPKRFVISSWPLVTRTAKQWGSVDHWSLMIAGLILVAPLLQGAPLLTDDGALHIYRTVALDQAIHDGVIYPRWFPDLAYGYGFPFFNYREPLGYYALELLHLLGLSIQLALNLVLAGSVIAGGLATAAWVGDIFDRLAGFVAGLVYMAAPYFLIGAITRANLPEVIALAWMPFILWAFRRLIVIGRQRYFVMAVLSYAGLLLTHNISSLIFTPVLLAYSLWLIAYSRWQTPRGAHETSDAAQYAVRNTLAAMLIALALTAFFWLPALAEGNLAQLYLTHSARGNDYHFNFLSLAELLGGPGTSDPALLNPPLRITLGWPQLALALLGILTIRRMQSREQRAHIIAAAVAFAGFLFMALPISLPLWDHLPLIRFVQFPWRFVGRAILPAALLAGAAAYTLFHSSRITRHASLIFIALVPLIFVAPLLYPRASSGKSDLSMTNVFAYEHATGHIGVDPLGAYLPDTVKQRPTGSPLEAQYAANLPIRRFDRSALPTGAQITSEVYGPNQAEIDLETPTGFRATYLTFDFAGWQVAIDGQPSPITPSDPTGLITFDVPAGQHHLSISFGSTPIRSLADALSIAGVLALAISILRVRAVEHRQATKPQSNLGVVVSPARLLLAGSWLLLVPLSFFLIKTWLIDAQLTPLRNSRLHGDQLAGVTHPLHVDFGDQLQLLGYDLSPSSAPSGDSVRLDLYWQALRPMDAAYQTTAGVVDTAGEIWSPKTLDRPRDYQDYPKTSQWPVDGYAVDSFELPINPGTPPGGYSIFVEAFTRDTLIPLPVQSGTPSPSSRPAAAIIGSIDITHAARTFGADQLGIYNFRVSQALMPDLTLIGFNLDRTDILPGDTVLLTLFWQAAQKPSNDYSLTIQLLDAQDRPVAQQAFQLGDGRYPTSQWTNGEQIIDLDRVRVPADTPAGDYRWRGVLSSGVSFDLGQLHVAAPERSFAMPSIEHRVDQTLGQKVTLLGYSLKGREVRGETLNLTLYWRAEAGMDKSYKVFVQLLDANGQPRAQVDAIPVNGARPTTTWLPSEIVTDNYPLILPADLPNGKYQLVTGMYGETDNMRLKLINGHDGIQLTAFDIGP